MVTQCGSLIGTNDGLAKGVGTSGLGTGVVMLHRASPDNTVTGLVGSALIHDIVNDELYMCEAQGGSEWIHIGSQT